MSDDVLLRREGRAGRITMNRPRALNALTYPMVLAIHRALEDWRNDPDIALVLLEGAGERGLCAGGDVRAMYDSAPAGSAFARATEAPGRGYHWGMATPHANLPRGTRIRVGIAGPLEQILFGPAFTEDGTLNLVGAIRTCMGSVGARTIRELQLTELIIAPTIKTEGKVFQQAQKLGRPR